MKIGPRKQQNLEDSRKNILSTAEAHDYYFREKGKRLTGPHHFGFDLPHKNIQMQKIRTMRFYEIYFFECRAYIYKVNFGRCSIF